MVVSASWSTARAAGRRVDDVHLSERPLKVPPILDCRGDSGERPDRRIENSLHGRRE
jgi:hypothetical protein